MSEPKMVGLGMNATDTIAAIERRARDQYHTSIGFRQRVQAVVHHALREHGPVNPDEADRDAHAIAEMVAATVLQMIYEEDAEIARLKADAERFYKLAADALAIRPMPMFAYHTGGNPADLLK